MEVYTNVNTDAQKKLWDIYNTGDYVAYPDDEMQVCVTVMELCKLVKSLPSSVLVTNLPTYPLVPTKLLKTNRDSGSSMKPITDYAPAFENEVYVFQLLLLSRMLHITSRIPAQIQSITGIRNTTAG